jgi:hypothetical protein
MISVLSAGLGVRRTMRRPTERRWSETCSTVSMTDPVRIVAFNTAQGWSRDVTDDIASELRKRCDVIPASLQDFLDEHGT